MGKSLMMKKEDHKKIESLMKLTGLKSKVDVIRTALSLLENDVSRKARVNRLKKSASIIGRSENKSRTEGESVVQALSFLKKDWKLTFMDLENILHVSDSTIQSWMKKSYILISEPLSPEIENVLILISIHRILSLMFEKNIHQINWLKTSHPSFGTSPLSKMSQSIEGLIAVHQYLLTTQRVL